MSYRSYLLCLLTIVASLSFADRFALGIMVESIKAELSLSDTQLGLVTGVAFASFYSVMGIPLARWADRADRILIISLSALVWSAMVALCGAAQTFVQLAMLRMLVGIGEAGCIPAANSLIADYYGRGERPRALAIFWLAASLGIFIGYFFAGWSNAFVGWRMTFVILGVPGIVFGLLTWLTLKDPRRDNKRDEKGNGPRESAASDRFRDVIVLLWRVPTYRHLLMSLSIIYFFSYGALQWQPAYFMRTFHLGVGEVGTWLALVFGLGGLVGTLCGGELAARFLPRNERAQLRWTAMLFVFLGFIEPWAYLVPMAGPAFLILGFVHLGRALSNGTILATVQTLVPPNVRAQSLAVIFLVANLVGMGLGPLAAGMISDALSPSVGQDSLRYGLLVLTPCYFWAAWHFWRASVSAEVDIASSPPVDADSRGG